MQDLRDRTRCYDCGAPVDPKRGVYSCVPESGSGVTVITEEQMATGEQVALTRRVYLDESKSAAIPAEPETREGEEGAPSATAAWLLGSVGAVISRARAEQLGLEEGVDFGEVPDPRIAIAQQEAANRATMRQSDATVLLPRPVIGESVPERNAFNRETGEPFDTSPLAPNTPTPEPTNEPTDEQPSSPYAGQGTSNTANE